MMTPSAPTHTDNRPGPALRRAVTERRVTPFIGVYDVFSASIAARHFDALFLSGFGFAASYYGMPDIGFNAWSDVVSFAQRVRTVMPHHHLLVDIDDGFCDLEVACHVTSVLESIGVSGVVLEDQLRPRKCGHYEGKQLMPLDGFLTKLRRVLETRRTMFVVARTDASEREEIVRRVEAFSAAGADAILVDGLREPEWIREMRAKSPLPFVFNQIAGGKSPALTLTELQALGFSMVIYSTPCLFAAHGAMEDALQHLAAHDGALPALPSGSSGLKATTVLLRENLTLRDRR